MIHCTDKNIEQASIPERRDDKRMIDSRQLFSTRNEIIIEHQGQEYRLRITRNSKLILTK